MGSPRHIIADSGPDDRPDQVSSVASVFGEPYEVDDKILIPVKQVRHFEMRWSRDGAVGVKLFGRPLSKAKPVAVIEVDEGEVGIVRIPDSPLLMIVPGIIVGA